MHASSSSHNSARVTKNALGIVNEDCESSRQNNNSSFPWSRSLYNSFLPLFAKPSTERSRASEQVNCFKVFLLLEAYLNLCYYLFLIPFRIAKDDGGVYKVVTNTAQQVSSQASTLKIV